ncbi:MAG: sensor histidine kinase, partial [Pseudomonadota bacterium]
GLRGSASGMSLQRSRKPVPAPGLHEASEPRSNMHNMNLRSTINWLITLVMLVFISSLMTLQISASRRSIAAEMEAATLITVQMLANLVSEAGNTGITTALPQLTEFLEQAGRIRAHDIEVIDSTNQLLYQSPPSPYKSGRNAPQWFSALVAPQTGATELPVDGGLLRIEPDYSRMVLDAWDDLLNLFWLSLALFTLMNLLVFWFAGRALKENHTWTKLIQRHVEDERRTLALELHDEVGQSLTAVRTIATTLVNRTRDKQPELQAAAQTIVDVSGQMYDAMHGIVRQLRPLVLDQLGLQAALQELVDSQRLRHPNIRITLTITGELTCVGSDVGIAAYRMVQECLTNIVRHAAATEATISVEATDKLTITVQDNGTGLRINPNDRSERYGLIGMRERAEALGGSFHWQGDNGVRVVVTLPLQTKELRE